jgi:flavin-binding protein dodecin
MRERGLFSELYSTERKEKAMTESDHVYKLIELTGTSAKGIEDAVNNALARAAKTVRNMRWFEVLETRGRIDGGKAGQWQVTIKVGFTLDD